jgi:hypothetical protein
VDRACRRRLGFGRVVGGWGGMPRVLANGSIPHSRVPLRSPCFRR